MNVHLLGCRHPKFRVDIHFLKLRRTSTGVTSAYTITGVKVRHGRIHAHRRDNCVTYFAHNFALKLLCQNHFICEIGETIYNYEIIYTHLTVRACEYPRHLPQRGHVSSRRIHCFSTPLQYIQTIVWNIESVCPSSW